jgi:hypothetical protein
LWGTVAPWPLIPIHAMLLPDGRVMSYGTNGDGKQTGHLIYDLWNPTLGLVNPTRPPHQTLPNTTATDLFCSAQIIMPQTGDVLLLGGDNWINPPGVTNNRGNNDANIFTTRNGTSMRRAGDMNRARWYATVTTLVSGNTFIQGGLDGADRPEIRKADGSFKLLTGVDTSALFWWYPRNWLARDERIFGYSDRSMYWIDPRGNGTLTRAGALPADGPSGVTSTEVMYRPGLILRAGGGSNASSGGTDGRSAALVINLNSVAPGATTAPQVTRVPPMPVGLHWATGTVVADGRVVVTGGSLKNNLLNGVNNRALIWTPTPNTTTGTWSQGAASTSGRARLYHSISLLLPDATVLVGGGGAPGPQVNTNGEIYYPPYLFTASGGFASRPLIVRSPTSFTVNSRFDLQVDRPLSIRRVTLVKTGSVTHSFDMEQRFIELAYTRSGSTLKVTTPASKGIAPPGRYLLFVIDAQGVPSVARILSLV